MFKIILFICSLVYVQGELPRFARIELQKQDVELAPEPAPYPASGWRPSRAFDLPPRPPATSYGVPDNSVMVGQLAQPQQVQYVAPAPTNAFTAQQNAYQPPPNAYSAQPNAFTAQQNAYQPPQNAYSAQPNAFTAQQNAYRPPQNAYSAQPAQQNAYRPPQSPNAAPQNSYSSPQNAYSAPQNAYSAPQKAVSAPRNAYSAPQSQNLATQGSQSAAQQVQPSNSYSAPQQQQLPREYGPPPSVYGPPTSTTESTVEETTTDNIESLKVKGIDEPEESERLTAADDVQSDEGAYYILLPNSKLQKILFRTDNDAKNMEYVARLTYKDEDRAPIFVLTGSN